MTSLLWLRRDLRRLDLPALLEARDGGGEVAVVFVIDPALWDSAGAVRRAWVAANVLAAAERYDGRLMVRVGDPATVVPDLATALGAHGVHVSAETTPYGAARDRRVEEALQEGPGVLLVRSGSPYAVGPGLVRNQAGDRYRVFTPFARAWREHGWPDPAPEVRALELVDPGAGNDQRHAERVLREAVADSPIDLPAPGEEAARRRWRDFLDERLGDYADDRDRPATAGTTGLSPYLKVGAIHPRTMLADLAAESGADAQTLRDEIAWREFYADVLHHEPASAWQDLRPLGISYDEPEEAGELVEAWREGRTGYPIVDAGMRQLAATGWMHNRVRMITASFLTKDLHLWWPGGARFFLDHLIDGDLASNNHGWQWVAGTGTDASPYFRVFNPITQGLRFDPTGDYVRRWVPELAGLSGKAAHEPWKHGGAPGYPDPVLDHAEERAEALGRYARRSP